MKPPTGLVAFNGRSHSDATKAAFAAWIATPTELRDPPTQRDWSERHSVSEVTLWRWRQQPEFRQEVAERIRAWYLEEMPDVIQAVLDRAKAGNIKASELLLRHVGEVWHGGEETPLAQQQQKTTAEDIAQALLTVHRRLRTREREQVTIEQGEAVEAEILPPGSDGKSAELGGRLEDQED